MTYASGGLIEAIDYNNFAASVNAIWGTGSGDSGWGQTNTVSNVAVTNTVTAAQWSTLISRMDSIDQHETATTTGITAPTAGATITYLSTLSSTIGTLTSSRLTTFGNGTSVTTTMPNATTWTTSSVKEISFTFPNTNAMRHYFNAGGYITFTGKDSVLAGNTKSTDWVALLTACGDVRINAQTSAKVGGSGSPTVNNTNLGFYDLPTTYGAGAIILQQYSTTATGGYTSNYATFEARLNAAAGSSTILYLRMTLTDGSADETLPANSNNVQGTVEFDAVLVPPNTAYLNNNSWGVPSNNTGANVANIYPTLVTNTQA